MSTLLRARSTLWLLGRCCLPRLQPPLVAVYSTRTAITSQSTHQKFNVQVGATLQLSLSKVDVDVNVCTGDNMEEIDVKAWWNLKGNPLPTLEAFSQQSNNQVCLDLQNEESRTRLQRLEVVMPERWCNLLVESGKGLVKVGNMKEANVSVTTSGGGVTLGEVRGNEAIINSRGGSITAVLITAALELNTGGGALLLKKVIGNAVCLDTGGGDIIIGSAYGQDLKILSRGGCIEIKHMQVQDLAHVSSNGGHVHIDGLDGKAKICSSGGNVQLQLLANAKEVTIDAAAGEITLYVSSEHDTMVEHVEKSDGDPSKDPLSQGEVCGLPQSKHPNCRVYIIGSGKVAVIKRSWLEAVMERKASSTKAV